MEDGGYRVTERSGGRALRDLWRFRGVLGALALRDVRVRYRHPTIGALWAVLQPLALAAAATVVFHRALDVPTEGVPHLAFAFAGLLAWTYFHAAVGAAVPSLVNDANLVRKTWFPREAIPLAPVLAGLLDLVACAVALVVLAALAGVGVGWNALWVLPLAVVLVAWTAACALAGAAVNVHFRDVKHAVPLLLQVLFFATPVVYPLSALPAAWRPWALANPLAGVVEGLRAAVLHDRPPPADALLAASGVAAAALALSYALYKRADRRFADAV
jgi:ABC-type polysaccharide/polyol phosphate export permease